MPDETQQAGVVGRIEGRLDQGFKDIGHRLDGLGNELSALRLILDGLRTAVTNHEGRIGTVEKAIEESRRDRRSRDSARSQWQRDAVTWGVSLIVGIGGAWAVVRFH